MIYEIIVGPFELGGCYGPVCILVNRNKDDANYNSALSGYVIANSWVQLGQAYTQSCVTETKILCQL